MQHGRHEPLVRRARVAQLRGAEDDARFEPGRGQRVPLRGHAGQGWHAARPPRPAACRAVPVDSGGGRGVLVVGVAAQDVQLRLGGHGVAQLRGAPGGEPRRLDAAEDGARRGHGDGRSRGRGEDHRQDGSDQ